MLDTKHRRDQLSIIAKILEITIRGSLKTPIMYQANLNYNQLNDYLHFLIKRKLIAQTINQDKEIYKSTEKGVNYILTYRELVRLLGKKQTRNSR